LEAKVEELETKQKELELRIEEVEDKVEMECKEAEKALNTAMKWRKCQVKKVR